MSNDNEHPDEQSKSKLQLIFVELAELIERFAGEQRKTITANVMVGRRMKILDYAKTETGIHINQTQLEYVHKPNWFRPTFLVIGKVKQSNVYISFLKQLEADVAKNVENELENFLLKLINRAFEGKLSGQNHLLELFVKACKRQPVPAWSENEVHGVLVKGVDRIEFSVGDRHFEFRQLDIEYYEKEDYDGFGGPRHNAGLPPNCIVKIRKEVSVPWELQLEEKKAETLLRLFTVCFATFAQHIHGSESPTFIASSGGKMDIVWPTDHLLDLTVDAVPRLKHFWEIVEPKLPEELREFASTKVTSTSIAYERYCDGLLTRHPMDRKIAYAIMGLEALYLKETEVQELMYRLQLRVCKMLSKLGFEAERVRDLLKAGYSIRNSYVHGGHLSQKDVERLKKDGIVVKELAMQLLDYLRISILHMIVSGESKKQFLDLLEGSFVSRQQDDLLEKALETEEPILRI